MKNLRADKKIIIDLSGPDGNAYALIAYAMRFARQLSIDPKEITSKMTSGDYEHLTSTFNEYFDNYVTLKN
jgi:hypothetical protein